jgi:NADH dehydrogenase
MAEVERIDLTRRLINTAGLPIPYDYLILATGTRDYFYGVPGAAEHVFSLKTLEAAINLRNHVLGCFERAEREEDAQRRRAMLGFVIVGGGPTGVEFAGALSELIQGPIAKDYPRIDLTEVRVVLLEGTDGLLPTLPQPLGVYARERLISMGVDVRLGALASRITREAVHLQDGTVIAADTTMWAAGVRGDPQVEASGLPVTSKGRVRVLPTLQLPDHPEVYVVGDLAHFEEDGSPLAMVAPVAIQQGAWAARNIERQLVGQDPLPFHYRDRGTMATIGRNHAAAHAYGRNHTGFAAWVLWLGVHLVNLIGFRNRLVVLVDWARNYVFRERAACRILPSEVESAS